ncbi:MAG: sulfite exporter TauE/SafE family protein [Thermoplasmata archaeon]|nr:sulfite exporter TauE/SafE family protein [Thermoplasmata archaeon]
MLSFAPGAGLGDPLVDLAILLLVAFLAGLVGALLGVGGGLFLVPALVLLFGIDIHLAIAASLVSVVATTSGTAASRVSAGQVNLRLGMFLEIGTAAGGLLGAIVSVTLLASQGRVLILLLIPVTLLAAALMAVGRRRERAAPAPPDPWADRLGLGGQFDDPLTGETESYPVRRTGWGFGLSALAGVTSGLLGVGGGIFKVPAMNVVMNVPFRMAAATSTLMIGVTASAGALVYLLAGDVALLLVGPVAIAVLSGSYLATRWGPTWSTLRLRFFFVGILLLAAGLMLFRGVGWLA